MKHIDCACVIHGQAYDWGYVEKLYAMLCRNLSPTVNMHVFTEAHRFVPQPFIKHELPDFGITDSKRIWWYKLCLFDTKYHSGPLLYFDLDTVVVGNLDWIWRCPLSFFWAIQDFKALWRTSHIGINSSIMWWDTAKFYHVWQAFQRRSIQEIMRTYHGDQDFINDALSENQRRFLDQQRIKSWRWQSLDGGYDFKKRLYRTPGTGTQIMPYDSVLIFHGKPKPGDCDDKVILQHWK